MSITELGSGKVLLHCFAGCGAAEVVRALEFEFSDLFPPEARAQTSTRCGPVRWNPRDLLSVIRQESLVVSCAAGQLDELSDEELERVRRAGERIEKALGVSNVC